MHLNPSEDFICSDFPKFSRSAGHGETQREYLALGQKILGLVVLLMALGLAALIAFGNVGVAAPVIPIESQLDQIRFSYERFMDHWRYP